MAMLGVAAEAAAELAARPKCRPFRAPSPGKERAAERAPESAREAAGAARATQPYPPQHERRHSAQMGSVMSKAGGRHSPPGWIRCQARLSLEDRGGHSHYGRRASRFQVWALF